jgi:hypothetical protein
LGPLAESGVRQIVAECDPGLATLVHHRTGDLLAAS